ncbi:MAG: PTS sugar transporter subunit IIA [Fusobacteriaceae bacterium]|nr:PTS sugar transporter subunit IIA [Fusobacteriaceae bacterium]
MARKLSELIKKENVVFLESIEINETLDLLIEKGVEIGKIKDSNIFKESVLEREKLVSTGIGHGIAMPHTKSSQVEDFFIIVGLNKNGIDWDAIDRNPVGVVFLIGTSTSDEAQKEYLQVVSKLMLLLKNKERREELIDAKSGEEVENLFDKF